MKILAITICFILFFSVFAALIYFDFHGVQAEFSFKHKDHCHISYLFQKAKEGSFNLANFKFLNLFSLFESNSGNLYLAKARSPHFDIVSDSQQKLNQTNQLLAVVKIE